MTRLDEERVKTALRQCWSSQTSTLWSPENPALGQCAVTALVVHDHFAGRLLKTEIRGQWHFYNEISGNRYDFTREQFTEPVTYSDLPTSREEAFADTTSEQFNQLSRLFTLRYREMASGDIV